MVMTDRSRRTTYRSPASQEAVGGRRTLSSRLSRLDTQNMSRGKKKLTKNRDDSMIAGVCAGLADYYDTDPTLVRAIFIAASVAGGFGPALYIVLWILLDDADPEPPTSPPSSTTAAVDHVNRPQVDTVDVPIPPAPSPAVQPADAADRPNHQNDTPRQ